MDSDTIAGMMYVNDLIEKTITKKMDTYMKVLAAIILVIAFIFVVYTNQNKKKADNAIMRT